MAGQSLTTASSLQCPHGGAVIIVSTNPRARAGGAPAATAADIFIVAGCPISSPCVSVRWVVPDARVKVNGVPSLSRSSLGLCLNGLQIPQGTVVVLNTQTEVQSQ
jgi:hypothetical protein